MKTIADFKKKAILNSEWKCIMEFGIFTGYNAKDGSPMYDRIEKTRTVSVVQSKQIAFKTKNSKDVFVNSWIEYPKASNVKFPDENTMQVYEDGKLILTYIFIK